MGTREQKYHPHKFPYIYIIHDVNTTKEISSVPNTETLKSSPDVPHLLLRINTKQAYVLAKWNPSGFLLNI